MSDLIDRQALMKEFADFVRESNNSDFARTPTWNDAVSLVGSMPSAQPDVPDTNVGELISRQEALIAIMDLYPGIPRVPWLRRKWARRYEPYIDAEKAIKRLPPAEPERKTGKWIYGEHDVAMCDGYWCDKCGFFVPWDYKHKSIDFINDYHFCPSCGTKMEGNG